MSMLEPLVLFVRGGPSLATSTARSGFVLCRGAVAVAGVYGLAPA